MHLTVDTRQWTQHVRGLRHQCESLPFWAQAYTALYKAECSAPESPFSRMTNSATFCRMSGMIGRSQDSLGRPVGMGRSQDSLGHPVGRSQDSFSRPMGMPKLLSASLSSPELKVRSRH